MISTKKILDETDKKIIALAAGGKTAIQIAEEIHLSNRTIEKRIARMKQRKGCKSLTHLVVTILQLAKS